MSASMRENYTHWTVVPVRWGDVDRMGHVNNVQFFRYSEEARTHWIAELGYGMSGISQQDQGMILAEMRCCFIRQLRHPAMVHVGTQVVRIGNSSLQIQQGFFVEASDDPVATSDSRIVWFDYLVQRSAPLPDTLRERIRQMQLTVSEEI